MSGARKMEVLDAEDMAKRLPTTSGGNPGNLAVPLRDPAEAPSAVIAENLLLGNNKEPTEAPSS